MVNMSNKILVALATVLALEAGEIPLTEAQVIGSQRPSERQVVRRHHSAFQLEQILQQFSRKLGLRREDFTVSEHYYHTGTFPFWGYKTGTYMVATSPDKNHHIFFSTIGEYIGHVYRVTDEKNTWIAEKTDPNNINNVVSRTKYRSTREGKIWLYRDDYLPNGEIKRDLMSAHVYKVKGNQLIRDTPDYRRHYGGEGQHYIDDRGLGKFLVIQRQRLNLQGKVIEEFGEFFHVTPDNWQDYEGKLRTRVKRQPNSTSLIPFELSRQEMEVYRTIVPKSMQVR